MPNSADSNSHIAPKDRNSFRLTVLILNLAILAMFSRVAGYGFISFDDPHYIAQNPNVLAGLSWQGFKWAWTSTATGGMWIPLTWLSYQATISWFGANPGAQHLVNLLFHCLNATLLFSLLDRTTSNRFASAFTAFLFALHPTRVESVVWITERKDVLSTFFGLLAVWCYLEDFRSPGWLKKLGCYISFALSLCSKAMLVTMPVLLLALDYWPLNRIRSSKDAFRLLGKKSVWILLAVSVALVTLGAQARAGAVADLGADPLSHRITNALHSWLAYLRMAVWPSGLAAFYPNIDPGDRWFSWRMALGAAGLAIPTILVILWRHRYPFILTGWAWYLVSLLPVIGLVQVGSQSMADRFTYVPYIGLFFLFAWGFHEVVIAWQVPPWFRNSLAGALLLLIWMLGYRQVSFWKDNITLWEHATQVTRLNYLAHAQAGGAYAQAGNYQRAAFHLFEATQIMPGNSAFQYDLGIVQVQLRDWDRAAVSFAAAAQGNYRSPYLNYYLGLTWAHSGDPWKAIPKLRAFLQENEGQEMHPRFLHRAWLELGLCLIRTDHEEEGRTWLLKVKEADPGILSLAVTEGDLILLPGGPRR